MEMKGQDGHFIEKEYAKVPKKQIMCKQNKM